LYEDLSAEIITNTYILSVFFKGGLFMKKKLVSGLVLAAMSMSVLAGCGNSSTPNAGTTAAASTAGTTASADAKTTDSSAAAETGSKAASGDAASVDVSSVWPDGTTVYVDVPAKAGGGTDLYTRYLTQALQEVCPKVNFVVTNYDTGEVGMQHTKNAKPDGKTLNVSHGGGIIQYFTGASQTSMKDDLTVVGLVNQGGPQAIIANPDAEYTNFTELADYIKAHPGELTVGCSLGGTTQVLFTSLIEELVGDTKLVNFVQCSSEADKLTQVASKAINIANCSIPNAKDYDADGKLTILGTLGPKASTLESMSELLGEDLDKKFASTVEQGVNCTWDSNYYLLAPAGLSDEAAQAINSAVMAAEKQQSFTDGNKKMATFAEPVNLEDARAAFDKEWSSLDELVGSMGLKKR
jgi:tripartite-type tricarboxylate transporter receptor subunit TctC